MANPRATPRLEEAGRAGCVCGAVVIWHSSNSSFDAHLSDEILAGNRIIAAFRGPLRDRWKPIVPYTVPVVGFGPFARRGLEAAEHFGGRESTRQRLARVAIWRRGGWPI